MTTTRTTAARLRKAATTYASSVWGMTLRKITADEVLTMEIRADGYANAHVEGEHEANGLCTFPSARDCGEAGAAAEFVETTEGISVTASDLGMSTAPAATGSHAGHDHPATKAARAACRRQAGKAVDPA